MAINVEEEAWRDRKEDDEGLFSSKNSSLSPSGQFTSLAPCLGQPSAPPSLLLHGPAPGPAPVPRC
eukprot:1583017-Pyramimonas_sp.AAC.1